MKLIKECFEYNPCSEADTAECVCDHLPSEEEIRQRIINLNPSLDECCLEAVTSRLRDAVRCYMECLAEEFGVLALDSVDAVEVILRDLRDEGVEDPDLVALFAAGETEKESDFALQVDSGVSEDSTEEDSEEVPAEDCWRIIYRHPTGIYATLVCKGDKDAARDVLSAEYEPRESHFTSITRGEFEELLKEGVPELKLSTEVGSIEDSECPAVSEDEVPETAEVDVEKEFFEAPAKELESDLFEEDLDVSVNTDQQSVSVAEKDSNLDIEINSEDDGDVERDAEVELQELAEDPKYAKAFAYLMSTLRADAESASPTSNVQVNAESAKEPIERPTSSELELETDPPKGPEESYVAEQLGILIKDEYDAIEGYNKFLQELEANNLGDESDRKVVCDILAEENVHVGQLQELLKRVAPTAENIDVGAEEAQEQLGEEDKRDED